MDEKHQLELENLTEGEHLLVLHGHLLQEESDCLYSRHTTSCGTLCK